MKPEEQARHDIDRPSEAAAWIIQDYKDLNLGAGLGVAARAFAPMTPAEMAECRRRAAEAVVGKGRCWWNPDGR